MVLTRSLVLCLLIDTIDLQMQYLLMFIVFRYKDI
jgi:hypothetical protein